jgi:hypothetical protein
MDLEKEHVMGEKQLPPTIVALDIWRHELVARYMDYLGADFKITSDRDDGSLNFEFPAIQGLCLHGYFQIDGQIGRTVCVLDIDVDDEGFSRVSWESDKGWLYSMMGVEDEKRVSERAEKFLREMNKALGTDFGIGHDVSISEATAKSIICYHADAIMAARRSV